MCGGWAKPNKLASAGYNSSSQRTFNSVLKVKSELDQLKILSLRKLVNSDRNFLREMRIKAQES